MTHEHAWTRLPDLLVDRDEPLLTAHVAACHDCQRQLFLLGRVDRALRGTAAVRRRQRRRIGRVRRLRFGSGLVAAVAAAIVLVLVLPREHALREFTLRIPSGEAIGRASLSHADADNVSLMLVARGLPARRSDVYVLWAAGAGRAATTVGRFMVDPNGACRARFNLPAGQRWGHFWVTPRGRPDIVVATT